MIAVYELYTCVPPFPCTQEPGYSSPSIWNTAFRGFFMTGCPSCCQAHEWDTVLKSPKPYILSKNSTNTVVERRHCDYDI